MVDWDKDMLETMREMRQRGEPILLCSERIGVSYPEAVYKARELQLSQRMNRGRRPGIAVVAESRDE